MASSVHLRQSGINRYGDVTLVIWALGVWAFAIMAFLLGARGVARAIGIDAGIMVAGVAVALAVAGGVRRFSWRRRQALACVFLAGFVVTVGLGTRGAPRTPVQHAEDIQTILEQNHENQVERDQSKGITDTDGVAGGYATQRTMGEFGHEVATTDTPPALDDSVTDSTPPKPSEQWLNQIQNWVSQHKTPQPDNTPAPAPPPNTPPPQRPKDLITFMLQILAGLPRAIAALLDGLLSLGTTAQYRSDATALAARITTAGPLPTEADIEDLLRQVPDDRRAKAAEYITQLIEQSGRSDSDKQEAKRLLNAAMQKVPAKSNDIASVIAQDVTAKKACADIFQDAGTPNSYATPAESTRVHDILTGAGDDYVACWNEKFKLPGTRTVKEATPPAQ
jgi:hypothetical protein